MAAHGNDKNKYIGNKVKNAEITTINFRRKDLYNNNWTGAIYQKTINRLRTVG